MPFIRVLRFVAHIGEELRLDLESLKCGVSGFPYISSKGFEASDVQ